MIENSFMEAVRSHQTEVVKSFLSEDVLCDIDERARSNAIVESCHCGFVDIVDLFLNNKNFYLLDEHCVLVIDRLSYDEKCFDLLKKFRKQEVSAKLRNKKTMKKFIEKAKSFIEKYENYENVNFFTASRYNFAKSAIGLIEAFEEEKKLKLAELTFGKKYSESSDEEKQFVREPLRAWYFEEQEKLNKEIAKLYIAWKKSIGKDTFADILEEEPLLLRY